MRSLSLFFVGVLLVSAVPAGAAVDTVADGTAPAPALSDAASDELVVETVFSLEGTDADEVRVIREYHVGSDIQELSESIYYPIEDVSTRNMRRQGGIFEWDGSGDVARIEYVAQAEDVGSQVGATRGDGYAVVSTTYDHIRTDADRLTTEVSVDGEGTAGEQFAVLGGYTEYSRDTPTGEYRVVVPDHVDFRGNATEMLDQIEYTDTQLGARAGRDGEATYFVVDLDLGIVSGRAFESSATGNTAGDVLLDNTGPTTTTHEAVHQQAQAYRPDSATDWTIEGGASYYESLLLLQNGFYPFEKFVRETTPRDVDTDSRLSEPDSWADRETPYSLGANVIAYIDREIRAVTDGERTFEAVLRRMNDYDGTLTHEAFLDIVAAVGNRDIASDVDRYVTTEERAPAPSNPYAYTDPTIDSELSFTADSAVDRGGGQYRQVRVTLENSGSHRSGTVGFNATLPDGWNLTGVAPAAKGAQYMHSDPVPGADLGYFAVPADNSTGFIFYLRLPENRTEGDYEVEFSARDLAGQTATTSGTIEVGLATEDGEESDEGESDGEPRLDGAPPSSSLEKSLDSSAVLGTATYEDQPVPVVERDVSLNLTASLQNDTYPVHSYQFSPISNPATYSQNGTFSLTPKTQGPKQYHLAASLENGESVDQRFWLLVNDPPEVSIDSRSALFDPTVMMDARVDNDYGDHEVVWLVDGERAGTGETYRYERTDSPANVTVVVRDEYGGTDQDSQTVSVRSLPAAVTRAPVETLSDRPAIAGLGGILIVVLLLGLRRIV